MMNEEQSTSSLSSPQLTPPPSPQLPSPFNHSPVEGPPQPGLDDDPLDIDIPLAAVPLRWMPPPGVPCVSGDVYTKRRGRSRTKSVVDAMRECLLLPLGWLEQEVHRTSGNQLGKVEKFYIDPITLKIFRSISTSRKHMDDKFGPRDWSIYDSKGLGLNRKRSRKKPRRAAQAPFSIKDGVEGDAPAPAPAVGSSELTSAQDQKGKTPLVASDD